MASQAAIDGIGRYGLGWKHFITLGDLPKRIGAYRDNPPENKEQADDLTKIMRQVAQRTQQFVDTLPKEMQDDAFAAGEIEDAFSFFQTEDAHESIEETFNGDSEGFVKEVVWWVNVLYDAFDYYRILVK